MTNRKYTNNSWTNASRLQSVGLLRHLKTLYITHKKVRIPYTGKNDTVSILSLLNLLMIVFYKKELGRFIASYQTGYRF
jgi:hypothetical protein